MDDFTQISKVYIIDSPSEDDLFVGREEGSAISSSLSLAGIKNQYFEAPNLKMIIEAFEFIGDDMNKLKSTGLVAPFIHFSCHGYDDGIILTSHECITWEDLRDIIGSLNSKIGKVMPILSKPHIQISPVSYSFSSCRGFKGIRIQEGIWENLFFTLIGPVEDIVWTDSVVAFITFYHQVLCKKTPSIKAVEIMNIAAGTGDVFQVSTGAFLARKEDE